MFVDIMWSLVAAVLIVGVVALIAVWAIKTTTGKIFVVGVLGFILLALASGVLADGVQERTAWVEEIHFNPDYILLRDEDGEPWVFPFSCFREELDFAVGEEHTVFYDPTAQNQWARVYWLDEEVELCHPCTT